MTEGHGRADQHGATAVLVVNCWLSPLPGLVYHGWAGRGKTTKGVHCLAATVAPHHCYKIGEGSAPFPERPEFARKFSAGILECTGYYAQLPWYGWVRWPGTCGGFSEPNKALISLCDWFLLSIPVRGARVPERTWTWWSPSHNGLQQSCSSARGPTVSARRRRGCSRAGSTLATPVPVSQQE